MSKAIEKNVNMLYCLLVFFVNFNRFGLLCQNNGNGVLLTNNLPIMIAK